MLIRVLGSSAGGGFPQWNCGCPNCDGLRSGILDAEPRTQESVALSADGVSWVLLNASPDIGRQIQASRCLAPRGRRHSPIAAIVLTNGDLDHCLGLFSLRESQPLVVYATERVRQGLVERNVMARTLDRFRDQVTWRRIVLGREQELVPAEGGRNGLGLTGVAAPGKLPLHLEGLMAPDPEDNVGLVIRERPTGRSLAYFPAAASVTPPIRKAAETADAVFFDGTFWSSDELIRLGVGLKRAEEMAHLPIGGEGGSLARCSDLAATRRIYIHVNNTNPILDPRSPERASVEERGWEVAADGMEVAL